MTDADSAEIARLALLAALDYERERELAAERLGCRVAILDRLVEAARNPGTPDAPDEGGSGRKLPIPEIEPWPMLVAGADLLQELSATILLYVVIDRAAADALALWIVHTHAVEAAMVSPRLAIT